jgi:hypothetical protein
MDNPLAKVLAVMTFCGLFITSAGVLRCIVGYTFSLEAQHEKSTVGRLVGRHPEHHLYHSVPHLNPFADQEFVYHYVFPVNGVQMDDYDRVCKTPLAPGGCGKAGPVLVYYSYQPFSMSRMEDFAVAGRNTTQSARLPLAIGLPLLLLGVAGIFARHPVRPEKASNWPAAEATIQTVSDLSAENPEKNYLGDFTYIVNEDYFSGKVRISRSFSAHNDSANNLIDQKFQVNYNPRKPEKYSVPQAELGGFLLDPYDG